MNDLDNQLGDAIEAHDVQRVAALLAAGANPDAIIRQTPLIMWIFDEGGNDPDILKLLIDAGANVNARSQDDDSTALLWAVNDDIRWMFQENHRQQLYGDSYDPDSLRSIKMLLDAGANPYLQDNEGTSPYTFSERARHTIDQIIEPRRINHVKRKTQSYLTSPKLLKAQHQIFCQKLEDENNLPEIKGMAQALGIPIHNRKKIDLCASIANKLITHELLGLSIAEEVEY